MLTQAKLKEVIEYDPNTGEFLWLGRERFGSRGDSPRGTSAKGYHRFQVRGKKYMAHRLAWLYVYGEWPSQIDHINQDKKDNRIKNLREVTTSENCQNRPLRADNLTGHKGVFAYRRAKDIAWVMQISTSSTTRVKEVYDTYADAVAAYERLAKLHHTHAPVTDRAHPYDRDMD